MEQIQFTSMSYGQDNLTVARIRKAKVQLLTNLNFTIHMDMESKHENQAGKKGETHQNEK
jgi:hypothetical protein